MKDSSPKRYKCTVPGCQKSFGKPSRLETHIRIHTKERPFKCEIDGCQKSYARQQHLSRHIQTWHCTMAQKEALRVTCPECSMECATNDVLIRHMQLHQKEKKAAKVYKCPEEGCKEKFLKRKQLVAHRLQHAGHLAIAERCHKCPYENCGKTFVFPNVLRRHMKIHQGYPCDSDNCSEVLPTWSALRKHKAQQHQDLTCNMCGVTMTTKSNLRQHLRTHLPARQTVVCQEEGCGRTFAHPKNLRQHIRAHHKGEAIWKGRGVKKHITNQQTQGKKRSTAACWLYLNDRGDELKVSHRASAETRKMFRKETKAAKVATGSPGDASGSRVSETEGGFCEKPKDVTSPMPPHSVKPVKERPPFTADPLHSVNFDQTCSLNQSHVEKLNPTDPSSPNSDPKHSVKSAEKNLHWRHKSFAPAERNIESLVINTGDNEFNSHNRVT